jgi:hypothetical protein
MKINTKHFEIEVTGERGYFEHHTKGDEYAGGLWFNTVRELVDYDGVFELPTEVIEALFANGYDMTYALDDDGPVHQREYNPDNFHAI